MGFRARTRRMEQLRALPPPAKKLAAKKKVHLLQIGDDRGEELIAAIIPRAVQGDLLSAEPASAWPLQVAPTSSLHQRSRLEACATS